MASPAELLRVGTSGDYPPFSREESAGTLRGFDLELADHLGRELGLQVELIRFKWPDLMADLRDGAFDIVMSGVTMRPERAIDGRYTRPYAKTGAVALIRRADAGRFQSFGALNAPGRTIVVNAGGHLEHVARRFFSRASIRTVSDNLSLPALVRSGKAEAAISDSAEATAVMHDDLLALGPFSSDYKAFLLPAASADLALRVDAWLVRHERDGWLGQQREKWLATRDPADEQTATRQAVVAAIGLRLGLMPFVAAAKRAGGSPVEDPRQEAKVLARVRNQSFAAPERTEGVYRLLIRMAKGIQRTVTPPATMIPLASLRDAIVRIDEQLVRELDRLPASRDSDWMPLLAARLAELSVDGGLQTQLAEALSSPSRSR
jgi:cyclohexadienyl dehydratase